jgi:hypothetical protein
MSVAAEWPKIVRSYFDQDLERMCEALIPLGSFFPRMLVARFLLQQQFQLLHSLWSWKKFCYTHMLRAFIANVVFHQV